MELQSLKNTIVPGRAARKVLLISEFLNPSTLDHRLTQDLSNCAATLQLQRGHRGDGKVGAQRRKDDLDLLSGLCADRTAQWKQFTKANAVVHPSKVSNHERFSQTVTDRHFVVEPKCDSGALFARPANPRVDLLCPACSKTCVSNSYLILHVRSHTDEKPFACAECDKKFSHSGNLTLHMGYHTGEKPFACVNCDKRFSQRGKLTIHIRSRTGAKGIRSHRLSGMSAD